jgi:hypothetical protein
MSEESDATVNNSGNPDEEVLTGFTPSGDSVAIARRLALSAMRVIGFLPVTGRRPGADMSLLVDLAEALTEFVSGDVGLVGDWRGWGSGGESAESSRETSTGNRAPAGRPSSSRVRRLIPSPASDRARASIELRKTIARQPEGLSRLLISLSDYASPGIIPAAVDWMDGVALLVPVRRARWKRVADVVRAVAPEKQLGVIVIEQ